MFLIESDGKAILKQIGLRIPEGFFVSFEDAAARLPGLDWSHPWYLKAQVLQGRRGKSGLVRRAGSIEEAQTIVQAIREAIRSTPCAGLWCEPETPHQAQWLVACDIDRERGALRVSYSSDGGMSVAQASTQTVAAAEDWERVDVPTSVKSVLQSLHAAMTPHDALSMEINPLAVLEDGSCVALDAKIELDDAAWFRHPEWSSLASVALANTAKSERERAYLALLQEAGHRGTLGRYVELDGDVAVILSGGGASLVAMDALMHAGMRPANYLESSGNPDPDGVRKAARIVFSKPGIRAVWIAGSFANFTDIQATVMAVLSALEEHQSRIPVVVRRDGPNADAAEQEAKAWATAHGIDLHFHRGDVDLERSAKILASLL